VSEVLFDATDLAVMRAFNDANLPHTADVEAWTRVREPGGTYTTTWTVEQNDLPCRLATVGTPAERLASGSFSEVKEFRVDFAYGTLIAPSNRRLVITHTLPGIASPLTMYVTGIPARTYEMQYTVLATTEGGQ
jgi:hypothetical protein